MRIVKTVLFFCLLAFLAWPRVEVTSAQTNQQKLEDLNNKIKEYSEQIEKLQSQGATLANQIAQFNAQINLTETKISQTQEQIVLLGGRIDQLEGSLDNLTEAFSSRVTETYKMARVDANPIILLSSENINEAVSKYHYLKKIQEADNMLITKLETAKNTYTDQKDELEDLEKVLGVQKQELDNQKVAKANLLAITRNDEARYQDLLEQARQEYESIQAILAGKGEETEVGQVSAGERIASIIQGASCNSSGSHLHFTVTQGSNVVNPFSYLRSGVSYQNCSGPGECSEGDAFNPAGSWNWPINETIKYSQGYGSTWAVRNTWAGRVYSFHNGIDINSTSSSDVHAVSDGTLYQGSISGTRGCRLRYVRVEHKDSDIETWYLHINY